LLVTVSLVIYRAVHRKSFFLLFEVRSSVYQSFKNLCIHYSDALRTLLLNPYCLCFCRIMFASIVLSVKYVI